MDPQMTPWLTLKEAADYAHVSESHMRFLVKSGKVRYTRLTPESASKYLFHHTWLDAFILGFGLFPDAEQRLRQEHLTGLTAITNAVHKVLDVLQALNRGDHEYDDLH
ncbi:MAG: hypothetical protein AUJ47_09395 [Candidatus Marinimicrobia bacterium CG1_02_48_14]|nr:MAG: hypothetical protein AUJ47_09395 [Candidatus Marinimicrobia bacterium CG1_02_48_14]PJA54060.1 MAG: hypothetical protein CO167_05915 [Candidatus Marinimicrobia bacterium CG_4_9_14_3_um_filter_48_9]